MMQGLFWFTAIFGVGVTVIDLLGLIGSGGQADGGSAAEAADDSNAGISSTAPARRAVGAVIRVSALGSALVGEASRRILHASG
jgi:hypothetical protein